MKKIFFALILIIVLTNIVVAEHETNVPEGMSWEEYKDMIEEQYEPKPKSIWEWFGSLLQTTVSANNYWGMCDQYCIFFDSLGDCDACNPGYTETNCAWHPDQMSVNDPWTSASAYCSDWLKPDPDYNKQCYCVAETGSCLEYHGEEWCCDDSSAIAYIIDDVFICLSDDLNPNEWCCIGGGCDTYDDYRFCYYPKLATCGDNSIFCCPPDYPVYNFQAGTCWKSDWECINDDYCPSYEKCENHKCEIREINVYRFFDNKCTLISILPSERVANDYDTLSECEANIVGEPEEINVYRFENNQCTPMIILLSERTANDYDTLTECEANIVGEPDKIDVYRFADNKCTLISILSSEKTADDYLTLEECKINIEDEIIRPNYLLYISIAIVIIFVIIIGIILIRRRR